MCVINSAGGITPSTWTHVALSCDGASDTCSAYKDGSLVETVDVPNYGTSTRHVRIGRDYTRGNNVFFHGRIDITEAGIIVSIIKQNLNNPLSEHNNS